jgi:hypothetical protein
MTNRLASYAPGSFLVTTEVGSGGGVVSPSRANTHYDQTLMSIHVYA